MTAAAWKLVVEEHTEHHWIASTGSVVIVVVSEGSHDDVGHVAAAARVVRRLHRKHEAPLQLLFVVPPKVSKAPSAQVRAAIVADARRLDASVDRAALVVLGSGFGSAVHRGAATGVIALLRLRTQWKITSSLTEALGFLIGEAHPALAEVSARCEEQLHDRR